jgi:hypothetical protein
MILSRNRSQSTSFKKGESLVWVIFLTCHHTANRLTLPQLLDVVSSFQVRPPIRIWDAIWEMMLRVNRNETLNESYITAAKKPGMPPEAPAPVLLG